MSTADQEPSIADMLCAIAAEHGEGAAYRAHKAAKKLMWKRLIAANQAATTAEIAGLRNVTGRAYVAAQKRIDVLFAEHERLREAAFGHLPPFEVRP